MTVDEGYINNLVERIDRCRKPSNWMDVEIEIAVFQPSELYESVRANSKATKVIYTMASGRELTQGAYDWTLNKENKEMAIALLTKKISENS